jgi:hypothetical protein
MQFKNGFWTYVHISTGQLYAVKKLPTEVFLKRNAGVDDPLLECFPIRVLSKGVLIIPNGKSIKLSELVFILESKELKGTNLFN